MTEPIRIRPAGPVLRAIVAVTLPTDGHAVVTPAPTQEYGGIDPAPAGSIVRLNIQDARRCFTWAARDIAGAIRDAAEVEVIGTNPLGVAEARAQLAAALDAGRDRLSG